MRKINKIKLSGTTYDIQDKNATNVINVSQAEYDALVQAGTVDPTTLYNITDAQAGDLSQYWTSAQTNSAITQAVSGKQDTLISGTNIKTINNESILGSGNIDIQGGGSIDVDSVLSTTSENPVQNKVITNTLNNLTKVSQNNDNGHVRWYDVRKHDNTVLFNINNFSINGRMPLSKQNGTDSNIDNFSLVETSAITTSISSSSTDAQVPSAKAVNDKLGGLSLVKLTQSEYDALATKDNSTLYVVVN
jgi:hypothetical protein